MSERSRALIVLRRFDGFLHGRLRVLRAIGVPSESVFIKAVEELHRILDDRLPASPEGEARGSSGGVPRMAIRPRRAGGQRTTPATGEAESIFVVDYSREMLCLARSGSLLQEGIPVRTAETSPDVAGSAALSGPGSP